MDNAFVRVNTCKRCQLESDLVNKDGLCWLCEYGTCEVEPHV